MNTTTKSVCLFRYFCGYQLVNKLLNDTKTIYFSQTVSQLPEKLGNVRPSLIIKEKKI